MKDNSIKSTADDSCQQRQHDHESATFSHSLQLAVAQGMDFSQIELRYRAEGNANLVLALPQFRKVLRLPKMSINNDNDDDDGNDDTPKQHQSTSDIVEKHQQEQQQQQQEDEYKQQERHNQLLLAKGSKQHNVLASIGDLTMADYVGYIDVVRRLLGSEFIFDAEIIEIPYVEQRRWINEKIRPFRPAQRLDKEFCGQFGLMLPDATLLPEANILFSNLQATPTLTSGDVYAIEIKPKQGWLLPSDVRDLFCKNQPEIPATTATATTASTTSTTSIRTCARNKAATRCRYCAMQYLKLKKHKINARSSYCPMELFSGIPARMFTALSALLECPQNNLRIFRNGNLIYGDHSSSISWNELRMNVFKGDMLQIVQHLVVKCLLRNYEAGASIATAESGTKSVAVAVADDAAAPAAATAAAVGAVVDAVAGQPHSSATMQEDEQEDEEEDEVMVVSESECAKKRKLQLDTVASRTNEARAQISEAELLHLPKNCVLQKVLHLQLLAKHHLLYMWDSEFANNSTKSYVTLAKLLADAATEQVSWAKLSPEQRYLLGATALDCSVMIAFQETAADASLPHNHPHLVHLDEYQKSFLTKVTLLDLDPKPDSHFNKYVKQTAEAYQCLKEGLSSELSI